MEAHASRSDGPRLSIPEADQPYRGGRLRASKAAASRAAAVAAEEQASKGVRGAVRKARKAIEKRAKESQKK